MQELQECREYLNERGIESVEIAIILGSGLGGLVNAINPIVSLSYSQIPHMPVATVEFHFGRLIYGEIHGIRVLAWQGRFHYYEGHSMSQIVMPVRISKLLGAKCLLVSNASGGLNLEMKRGDLMCISDHINLLPENPLRGANLNELGPRFPDMSSPYSSVLRRALKQKSEQLGLTLKEGVYVSVQGPQLETRAEYRYLRIIGADAVGMSTVPEVIVAAHMGLPCAAISVITDECNPDDLEPFDLDGVVAAAQEAEPKLTALFSALIEDWKQIQL